MTNLQNNAVGQHAEDTKADILPCTRLKKKFCVFMFGWGGLATAGVIALTFLLCVTLIPSTTIFPVYDDPYENMIPLIQHGNIRVYPPHHVPGDTHSYFIALPPKNLSSYTAPLQRIVGGYPQEEVDVYRLCWLNNPTFEHPCFFDIQWLGAECTQSNDFGYREINGTFSPCFILRIENTGKWAPIPDTLLPMSHHRLEELQPQFVPVQCYLEFPNDVQKFKSIQVSPQKGFSRMYFPITKFDPKLYLSPVVIVQVKELQKGTNLTITCQLDAQNAYHLEDNGLATITFGS